MRRVARRINGEPVCPGCYQRPLERCAACEQMAPVHSRKSGEPVCDRCYRGTRRRCGSCGHVRRIALRATASSPDLCPACYWAPTSTCTRCGTTALSTGNTAGTPVCFSCVVVEQLDTVITRPDGTRDERLAPLLELFARVDQPRTLLIWVNRKPSAERPTRGIDVLARIASGELELTHDALDALDSTPSLTHVRALLIAAGILPDRDPHIAALERAITRTLARVKNNDDRRVLTSFARWDVLHRLRRRHSRDGAIPPTSANNAAGSITEAARFLNQLRASGTPLADATQAHVDQWLASGARARLRISTFLSWAHAQYHAPRLTVPAPRRELAPRALDQDERWSLARRMLTDDALPAADRVAGLLVTLYAQPLTRIASLRTEHVIDDATTMHLTLGSDWLLIPEPLADLIRQLPERRQRGLSGHSPNPHGWLYPGRNAGQHLHPETIRSRLATHGIRARDTRTAALLQLAAELPPTVLADLLGMHRNTATTWAKVAGGDWTRYAAARARTRD